MSDIKTHFIIGRCVKFGNKMRLINYIYQQLTAVLFDSARSVYGTLDQHIFFADRESPVCRLGQPPGGARWLIRVSQKGVVKTLVHSFYE